MGKIRVAAGGPRSEGHPAMIGLNEDFSQAAKEAASSEEVRGLVERVFAEGGLLQEVLQMDHRPQQETMATTTLRAWEVDEPLFFEAGTGVGKSLAYLVPGILRAMSSGRPLIVSTKTIALQEQIEKKDLPICRRLFQQHPSLKPYAGFRQTVLVGKNNYLCGTRLRQALAASRELFASQAEQDLQRIAAWAATTSTGLRQELEPEPLPEVWDWVEADGHACNKRNCRPETCFYRKAREALREAHVIIVNHSLLFSLLAAGHFPGGKTPGILFPHDFLVLDEAHTLPGVATDHFGMRLSHLGLRRQLLKLYHPGKGRGLLKRHGDPGLRRQVEELIRLSEVFFTSVRAQWLQNVQITRLRESGWHANTLDVPLRELIAGLAKREARLLEGPEKDEMEGLRRSLQAYRESLTEALELGDDEAVYWVEKSGKSDALVHLRSAPLDIAEPLRQRLFERQTGLLLTSATLAEGPDMASFQERVGAPGARSMRVTSPFDYPLQMDILVHARAPEPAPADGRLNIDFLSAQILQHGRTCPGGTLVLFTSYRDLNAVRERLLGTALDRERSLLAQGRGLGRGELLRRFKAEGNAVLLGTDTFWTGVDVQGPALSQVIITRLPFENPTHPVAEARAERCREAGRSPFHELLLPAALVKFRQGIGRLIRSHTDEGRLILLDARVLSRDYGRLFLDVLPHDQIQKIS